MTTEILEYQAVAAGTGTDPNVWVIARYTGLKKVIPDANDWDHVFMTLRPNTELFHMRFQMCFQLAGQYVSMAPYAAHVYKLIDTFPGLAVVVSYEKAYFVMERVFPDDAIVFERDWSREAPARYLLTIMLKPHTEQVLVSRESLLVVLSKML